MTNMEEKFPRALWVRLVIYTVVGHFFAGFVWFLFSVGGSK